jgi:hypothetical protein
MCVCVCVYSHVKYCALPVLCGYLNRHVLFVCHCCCLKSVKMSFIIKSARSKRLSLTFPAPNGVKPGAVCAHGVPALL